MEICGKVKRGIGLAQQMKEHRLFCASMLTGGRGLAQACHGRALKENPTKEGQPSPLSDHASVWAPGVGPTSSLACGDSGNPVTQLSPVTWWGIWLWCAQCSGVGDCLTWTKKHYHFVPPISSYATYLDTDASDVSSVYTSHA